MNKHTPKPRRAEKASLAALGEGKPVPPETWSLQDAKAKFSEVVRAAAHEPQHITLRGEPTAVVISEQEYARLRGGKVKSSRKPLTLLDALRACPYELEIPPRTRERERDIGL
jgi:prevent-host-death family protein